MKRSTPAQLIQAATSIPMAKNLQHSFSKPESEDPLLTGKAVFRNSLNPLQHCALKIIADRILDLIVGCNTILVAVRPVEVDVSRARQSAGQCDILSESADALTEKEKRANCIYSSLYACRNSI